MQEDARKAADAIYANYSEALEALKASLGPKVRVKIGGIEIELEKKKTLEENAASFYEKAKVAKKKTESVRNALGKEIHIEKKEVTRKEEKKKMVWYSQYHHLTTSEGFLVIGGKNADQNEEIIKRKTEKGDIVLHADIVGAPFTVVKSGGKKVTEKAIKEASFLAACYSRAWKLGLGNVEVYWVSPEQLSKEAPAGEYLSKGAFMVRGKKNMLGKIALGLTIGIDKGSVHLLTGSGKKPSVTIVLKPGDVEKEEAAKRILAIAAQKGVKASMEDVKRLLPGDCAISS